MMKRLFSSRRGATALTYGLTVGLIALAGLGAVTSTGSSVETLFTTVGDTIGGATGPGLGSATPTPEGPTEPTLALDGPWTLPADPNSLTDGTELTLIGAVAGVSGSVSVQYSAGSIRLCADSGCQSPTTGWSSSVTAGPGDYVQIRPSSSRGCRVGGGEVRIDSAAVSSPAEYYWVDPGHEQQTCTFYHQGTTASQVGTRYEGCSSSRCVSPGFLWFPSSDWDLCEDRPSYLAAGGEIRLVACN